MCSVLILPRHVWSSLTRSAKVRGIAVSVTPEELAALWEAQEGRCALTGLSLVLGKNGRERTASVDRIDSKKPYETGNVQWVHEHVNIMKNAYPQEYFVGMCEAIVVKSIMRRLT